MSVVSSLPFCLAIVVLQQTHTHTLSHTTRQTVPAEKLGAVVFWSVAILYRTRNFDQKMDKLTLTPVY